MRAHAGFAVGIDRSWPKSGVLDSSRPGGHGRVGGSSRGLSYLARRRLAVPSEGAAPPFSPFDEGGEQGAPTRQERDDELPGRRERFFEARMPSGVDSNEGAVSVGAGGEGELKVAIFVGHGFGEHGLSRENHDACVSNRGAVVRIADSPNPARASRWGDPLERRTIERQLETVLFRDLAPRRTPPPSQKIRADR